MEATVIIPAYNEAARIARTLKDLIQHFGQRVHFLVVVNGSTDATAAVVAELVKQHPSVLSSVVIREKIGKGGAVHEGFRRVSSPWVGYADADGATPPEDLDRLLMGLTEADGVIGSRYVAGASVQRTPTRRFVGGAFRLAVRSIVGLPFADTQCGYKAFRTDWIRRVLPRLVVRDMTFDVELLAFLSLLGARIREVPVRWTEVPGPRAGWQQHLMATGLSMLRTLWHIRRRLQQFTPTSSNP